MKIILHRSRKLFTQHWYFTIIAYNGEVLVTSEMYCNRLDALHSMQQLKTYAGVAPVYDGKGHLIEE
jgi:uncharacterized protein YegP (UPF0339 family)